MVVFNPDTLELQEEEDETVYPLHPVKWEINLDEVKFTPMEGYLNIINMKEEENGKKTLCNSNQKRDGRNG